MNRAEVGRVAMAALAVLSLGVGMNAQAASPLGKAGVPDDGVRPVMKGGEKAGVADDSIRPVMKGSEKSGVADDGVRPMPKKIEKTGVPDDSVRPAVKAMGRTRTVEQGTGAFKP